MLIYLAGPMSIYYEEGDFGYPVRWREYVKSVLGDQVKFYDPTLHFEYNKDYSFESIVKNNFYYLEKSDLILVDTQRLHKSPGTLFEIYIGWYLKKPIIGFGSNPFYNKPHVRVAITEQFDTVYDAIDYIRTMYLAHNYQSV